LKLYEAMFVLNPNECAKNWEAVRDLVHTMIEREGAQITLTQKFDDVRLAYGIGGFRRATYYLVHFEDEGPAVAPIRRAVGLDESTLRVMIVLDEDGAIEINPQLLQGLTRDQSRGSGGDYRRARPPMGGSRPPGSDNARPYEARQRPQN